MKTFIAAQIGLAPLAAFWLLLGFASPGAALAVGLAAALAMTAWRWTRREVYLIEIGALAAFLVMAAIDLAAPAVLRRRGSVAVLRRARPHRAGQRRAEAAVDCRLFARRLRRRIGEPDLLRRQHDDLRPVGGAVPHRRGDPGAQARRLRHDGGVRLRRDRLDLRPQGSHPLRPRAPDRQGRGLSLAGAALRSRATTKTRSTSPSSAPGSAA